MKKGGILLVTFFIGCGETFEDPMQVGHLCYFVHYTEDECCTMLEPFFDIIAMNRHFLNTIKKDTRLLICRVK